MGTYGPSFTSRITEPDSNARTVCHCPAGIFNATACSLGDSPIVSVQIHFHSFNHLWGVFAVQIRKSKTPKYLSELISTFRSSFFTFHFKNAFYFMRHKWPLFTLIHHTSAFQTCRFYISALILCTFQWRSFAPSGVLRLSPATDTVLPLCFTVIVRNIWQLNNFPLRPTRFCTKNARAPGIFTFNKIATITGYNIASSKNATILSNNHFNNIFVSFVRFVFVNQRLPF